MNNGKTPHTAYGRHLRAELNRQDVKVRELARRLRPDNPEQARRSIARWLTPEPESAVVPGRASRDSVTDALGLERGSLDDDLDEEDADVYAPLARAVQELVRREVERTVKERVA